MYLQTFLKRIDLKLHVQMQNDPFNSFFLSTFWLSFLFTFHTVYTNNAKEMSADK